MSEKEKVNNLANFEDKEKKDKKELERKKKEVEEQAINLRKSKEKNDLLDEIKGKLVDIKFEFENAGVNWWIVDEISKIIETGKVSKEEIKEIMEKIDEILKLNEKKKQIPQELVFTKKEYIKALQDDEVRKQLLKKIDKILDFTADKLQSVDNVFLLFGYYFLLDKNIQVIHDNCIDVKENLEKLED